MTDSNERAEKGREILKSRAAQGDPGTKQPHATDASVKAQEVVDDLKALQEKHGMKTRPPSASTESGNFEVPAHERTFVPPAGGGGTQAAAAAVGAAVAHIENEMIAEARIKSDPRWESDQKKFEMGQRGELGYLPPTTQDEKDNPPTTPAEQNARDLPKLEAAQETAKQVKGAINPTVDQADAVKDSQIRTGAGKPTTPAKPTPPPTRPAPPDDGKKYEWSEEQSRYILISG